MRINFECVHKNLIILINKLFCLEKEHFQFLDNSKIYVLSDWPPVSPDINIIELCWADLKAGVLSCKPTNIEELWRSCEKQWAMIPVPKIKNIYQSIPTRIQEVLKKKGLNTRY